MNSTARRLGLQNTKYNNPHGLADKGNLSTAADISRLAYIAMKHPLFREIVAKEKYTTNDVINQKGENVNYWWRNSNAMLGVEPGFRGVKTGITTTAGPCLCCYYTHQGASVIVTLLCSKSVEHRWKEMLRICHWATSKNRLEATAAQGREDLDKTSKKKDAAEKKEQGAASVILRGQEVIVAPRGALHETRSKQ